jgi:hypothetical protein
LDANTLQKNTPQSCLQNGQLMVKMCLIQILSFCAFAHQLLRTLPCLFLHDIRLVWIPTRFSERDTQLPSPNPLKTNLLPRHPISNNSITLVKKEHPMFFPKYSHNRLTASTSHIKQLHHFNERNTELPSPNTPTTNVLP